jgi:NADH-quinone oxidoreductase subunit L
MTGAAQATCGALLVAVPFAVALAGLLAPRASRTVGAALGVGGAAVAFMLAVILAFAVDAPTEYWWNWADLGDLAVTVGVRLDAVAALVAVAVTAVALAVQVYSVAYLEDDDRYGPYAAQVSLFTAAMLLVVVSGDLIALLVGWEVMGICSYLLIGHDRRLPEAPRAAVKAFLVTRVGDVGFLLGIALIGVNFDTFQITAVLTHVDQVGTGTLTTITLLLLAGVAGKSAQFPLHTWLPDAMAGPTPISALIHAATMVAAGVYVVARLFGLFRAAPATLAVLGVMAAITMLLGALAASTQQDIKRVLAWSTVSQLGYMTGALAVAAPPAALFHLLTHAGFKALLFLAAGIVIHGVGSNAMPAMGGLRRGMPVAFATMTIGLAALVGLPPFAGFWSKDEVIAAAWAGHSTGPGPAWSAWLVWLSAVLTVVVTGWYATRLWLRTFFGAPRSPEAEHPHQPSELMWVPVVVLAVPSALLGFAGLVPAVTRRLGFESPVTPGPGLLLPLVGVAVGIGAAWAVWRRDTGADPARILGPARQPLTEAFYFDTVIDVAVVRPVLALARAVRRADESIVDGAVEATAGRTRDLGTVLSRAHRAALPRAVIAVLLGAVLFGVVAAALLGGTR